MLLDLTDKIAGFFTRRMLIGRRMVVDFSSAKEKRVSVIVVPEGTFSFALSKKGDLHEIQLVSDAGTEVLATYDDSEEADYALKKLKVAMVRPLKRVVLACLGVIIVIFAFDLMTAPKAARQPNVRQNGPTSYNSGSGLSPEQLAALRERSTANAAGMPPAPALSPQPAIADGASSTSSPEAQAAISLLRGK